MTSKKNRQRGSRTHGGGTHKNRRGAGHRGGRGRAGRDKHEFHNYEPLGKHGFTRPDSVQDEVREVTVQELDENAALYAADGLAEETGDGYRIDARDVADDGYDADVVKVGEGPIPDPVLDAFGFRANDAFPMSALSNQAALAVRSTEQTAGSSVEIGGVDPTERRWELSLADRDIA